MTASVIVAPCWADRILLIPSPTGRCRTTPKGRGIPPEPIVRLRSSHSQGAELLCPRSVLSASVSSGPTTVDVEDLARDECGPFEIQDRVDDVADFAEPAKGVEFGHPLIG